MDKWINQFNRYIAGQGLRHSRPREIVAREFFHTSDHIGIEKLFKKVQQIDSKIGIATVYRTLNLLVGSGLAIRRDFSTGAASYEKNPERHHDHLICTECDEIVEFHREEIEKLQDDVASKNGYELQFHKMELYGRCRRCRKRSNKRPLKQ